MANQPVRIWAAALSTAATVALVAGCSPSSRDLTPLDPAPAGLEETGESGVDDPAGAVGAGREDFVDPDQVSEPVPVPESEPAGLPDLADHGLTAADEAAALSVAQDFVNAIWTWDYTDTSDRAGLERALPLATTQLQQHLAGFLDQPLYEAAEWDRLSSQGAVGSASEILSLSPAPDGSFREDCYTAQVIYRTFTVDAQGVYIAREEDARYATLTLTRTSADTAWLVSEIPYPETEQLIEETPR